MNASGIVPDGLYYILLDVAVGDKVSAPQKMYRQIKFVDGVASAVKTVPVYTVIVSAEQGVIDSVVFDEGCYACDPEGTTCTGNVYVNASSSVPTVAGSQFRSCTSTCSATSGSACDLKVFVTWTGTDANGAYFESANLRLSRFRQFGIGSLYDDVVTGVTDGVNQVVHTGSEVINGL